MQDLKKFWQGLPTWQKWAVVLVPVVTVVLIMVARRGLSTAPSSTVEAPTAPDNGSGSGSGLDAALAALGSSIDKLAAGQKQLASQQQDLAKIVATSNTKTSGYITDVSRAVDNVLGAITNAANGGVWGTHAGSSDPTGGPGSVVGAVIDDPVRKTTLDVWVDDDKYAGWVQREVNVDTSSEYENGILAAKRAYKEAQDSGSKEAMEKAHAEAERWRKLAGEAGVTLPEWAR